MIAVSDAARIGAQQVERAHSVGHYRADIDGLRGVAVLSVVGFHAFPELFPGGYVGVDVFFVISGFLITSVIVRQLGRSTFTLSDFYARRIRRIFPALVIVLAACLLFGWFALLPEELEHLGRHVGAASAFVSNFALWRESGYFDQAAELKPLLHLWSLGIEEQFYLIWPMLLLLLWKRQQNIAVSIAILTAASFLLSIALGQERPVADFYFPISRFWELGFGCLLAIVTRSPGSSTSVLNSAWGPEGWPRSVHSFLHSALPIVGIGLIGAAIFLLDRDTAFPGWAALLPTVGATCVIGVSGESWFQRRIMASAAIVLVGVISYPLYLWHWPLLSFATILESGTPEGGIRIAAVLLSIVLAWLTFRYFERPIRAQRGVRVTLALGGGLLILGMTGVVMYAAAGFRERFDFDVSAIRAEARTNSLCLNNFPEARDFNYCKSTKATPPAAVFLGDSRAQAIYDGTASAIGDRYSMTLLGRGGCPPLLNVPGANDHGCNDVWSAFVKFVADVRPAVVVVVGSGSALLRGPTESLKVAGIGFPISNDTYKEGLRALIAGLQKTSRVIYVREIPRYDSAPSCTLRPISLAGSQCSPSIAQGSVEMKLASYNSIVDEIQGEFPELLVVDSISTLCDGSMCSQKLRSGEIIYRDQIHLNLAGGRHFAQTSGLSDIVLEQLPKTEAPDVRGL